MPDFIPSGPFWRRTGAVVLVASLIGAAIWMTGKGGLAPRERAGAATIAAKGFVAGELLSGGPRRSSRSLLAEFRQAPTDALGEATAQALYAEGAFNDLLKYLDGPTPLLSDPAARALYRAETLAALHRYDEAIAAARSVGDAVAASEYAALIIAKNQYALGETAAARRALSDALRGPPDTAALAWLFRARLALDQNDVASARAAAVRANEKGAAAISLQNIELEALMRSGEASRAMTALRPRLSRAQKDDKIIDVEAVRLAAMGDALGGDDLEAARKLDTIAAWIDHQMRGPLLRALLKHRAGDHSQAEELVRNHLIYTPQDWVANDLLLEILNGRGGGEREERLIDQLIQSKPVRGFLRRSALARRQGDIAAAAQSLRDAAALSGSDERGAGGAVSFLLGPSAVKEIAESPPVRAELFASLRNLYEGEISAADAAIEKLVTGDAVDQLIAGDMYLVSGEGDKAAAIYEAALARWPTQAIFATRRARIDLRNGDVDAAKARLDPFVGPGFVGPDSSGINVRALRARMALAANNRAAAREMLADIPTPALLKNPQAANLLAQILASSEAAGDRARLAALIAEARRALPGSLEQARFFAAAQSDLAIGAYRSALLAAPEDVRLMREFAVYMTDRGAPGEAARFIERLTKENVQTDDISALLDELQAVSEGVTESLRPAVPGAEDAKSAFAAYARAPDDAQALYRYGMSLPAERDDLKTALLREACIFGAAAACPAPFRRMGGVE